jgi:hypothetical protein
MRGIAIETALFVFAVAANAVARQPSAQSGARQSLDDAWWTGPMLAPSASTLPRGHFLIEPYFFDVIVQGRYDREGGRGAVPHANGFGSLTYVLYGLADKLTVGMIPTFGYNTMSGAPGSGSVGMADLTLQAQYRLRQFHEGSWLPTISVAIQETLPTGRFDRLRDPATDGFGGGTYTTTIALFSQTYLWLPNERILRMRMNVSTAVSSDAVVRDVSVYGTKAGFRGSADRGNSIFVDAAWEYSVTRGWVLALDAFYRHDANTVVSGHDLLNAGRDVWLDSGSSEVIGLAPAIEYNLKPNLGVLLGVRFILAGRNTSVTLTPAVAINYVH